MNRTWSALRKRAVPLAVALLMAASTSAGAATGATPGFGTVQANAEERPYVVEGSLAYTLFIPAKSSAVEPNGDFLAMEAAAQKKRGLATAQVLGSVAAVRLWPLLIVASNGSQRAYQIGVRGVTKLQGVGKPDRTGGAGAPNRDLRGRCDGFCSRRSREARRVSRRRCVAVGAAEGHRERSAFSPSIIADADRGRAGREHPR